MQLPHRVHILRFLHTGVWDIGAEAHLLHLRTLRDARFIAGDVKFTGDHKQRQYRPDDEKALPFCMENAHGLLHQHLGCKITDESPCHQQDDRHQRSAGGAEAVSEEFSRHKSGKDQCRAKGHAVFENGFENRDGYGVSRRLHPPAAIQQQRERREQDARSTVTDQDVFSVDQHYAVPIQNVYALLQQSSRPVADSVGSVFWI